MYFLVGFIVSKNKECCFFVFVVYYFIMLLPVVFSCAVVPRFYWKRIFRRGFREVFVGSESAIDYFNIQKPWCMAWWVVVFVIMVCFESAFDWEIVWVVCCYCISWLILRLIDMIVDFGSFWLNGCGFVRKKKNKGRTVYCNVAVVKPYVKMSARWSMRLFLLILAVCCENVFLFWMSLCERHKLNRLPNSDDTVLVLKKTQRVVRSCFNCADFMAQTAAA